jgi:hypothetical protein
LKTLSLYLAIESGDREADSTGRRTKSRERKQNRGKSNGVCGRRLSVRGGGIDGKQRQNQKERQQVQAELRGFYILLGREETVAGIAES